MDIYKQYAVGTKHQTTKGSEVEILSQVGRDEGVDIKLNGITKRVPFLMMVSSIKSKNAPAPVKTVKANKPPLSIGKGKYNSTYKSKYYGVAILYPRWRQMIDKCYSANMATNYASFGAKGYLVCREWHNFQNFAQWAERQAGHNKFELKILDGKKVFSPQNCYVEIK